MILYLKIKPNYSKYTKKKQKVIDFLQIFVKKMLFL